VKSSFKIHVSSLQNGPVTPAKEHGLEANLLIVIKDCHSKEANLVNNFKVGTHSVTDEESFLLTGTFFF
jgi:hypothetical protein